jgi:hypothetical protein
VRRANGGERRGAQRARFEGWVEIRLDGERRRVRGYDLSTAGIGIQSAEPLPESAERVVSEFPLPGIGLPLALEACPVWTDAGCGRLGLRFLHVDPGLSDLLQSYVDGKL